MTRGRYLLKWLRGIGIQGQLLRRLRLITVLKDSGRECLWLLWSSINIAVNKIILHNLMLLLLLLMGWRIAMNVWRGSLSVAHHLKGVLRSHPERGLRSVLTYSVLSAEWSIILRYSVVGHSHIAALWSLSSVGSTAPLWRIIATGHVIVWCRRNRSHLMIGLRLVLGILPWIVHDIWVGAAVYLERFRLVGVRRLRVMRRSFHWVNRAMAQI